MTQDKQEPNSSDAVREAIGSPDVPQSYANGFAIGMSNADTHILFQLNGKPVVMMNMSYTLTKTLHQKLENMIERFEAGAKRPMLTTGEVDEIFRTKEDE